MSIIRQLWLAIVIMMLLAFGGSFMVSTLSAKHYLGQQLQMKNIDNAASLALSLSQIPKEPVNVDLMLAAQFDTGHYQYIHLVAPTGETISKHESGPEQNRAPEWFIRLFPMHVEAGVAQVHDGWTQYGTLKLKSHSRFAYAQLWNGAQLALLWSLVLSLVTGFLGSLALRSILRPLKDVIDQAEAIGDRRFIRIAEPRTVEFRQLVVAMNRLSDRIRNTLQEESARLERLRQQANYDSVSGLMNRSYFFSRVDALLANEESFVKGALVITNFSNLTLINQKLGHEETNAMIRRMGDALNELCKHEPTLVAGRLTGTDFAVFSASPADEYALSGRIKSALSRAAEIQETLPEPCLPTVACPVTKEIEHIEEIVKLISVVMIGISPDKADMLHVMQQQNVELQQQSEAEWRSILGSAMDEDRLKLAYFPVVDQNHLLLHHESPVRLQVKAGGDWLPAGEFISWAMRLDLLMQIDFAVATLAIRALNAGHDPIGLNVSTRAICNAEFIEKLTQLIKHSQRSAYRLWLEVPEHGAFGHPAEFRAFCAALKPLGCKIGIEHVGTQISRLGEMHDIGLDYIKIDASLIHGIQNNVGNKALLRGLCQIAHSIGVIAIAEGVQSMEEMTCLPELGIDGMTGPAVTKLLA